MNMHTTVASGPAFERRMPWVIRALGGRFPDGRNSYRMRWGSLSFRRGVACELALFEEGYSLHLHALWVQVFVRLPFLRRWAYDPSEIMESWGASCQDMTLHLHWGHHTKVIWLPWRNWKQVAHDVRRADGSWVPFVGCWEEQREGRPPLNHRGEPWKEPDGRHTESYPYRYLLRSGEVQHCDATIYVERRRRRLAMLPSWLRVFDRVTHSIDVSFSAEVGERSGLWKGGTVGCGYDLRPDETPRECLTRMERDRKF